MQLLKRKYELENMINKYQNELNDINEILKEKPNTEIEICSDCEFYYAGASLPFIYFSNITYESFTPNDVYFRCHCCGCLLRRHDSFIDTLKRMRDEEHLNDIFSTYSQYLTKETTLLLIEIIRNVSVPSFSMIVENINGFERQINELKRYNILKVVEMLNSPDQDIVIVLNAKELALYDNLDILNTIGIQQIFETEQPSANSKIRYEKLKNLPNDFTKEQKEYLLKKFDNRCAFTGELVNLEIDHVIPVNWEIEGTTISNLLPIWDKINSSKRDNNVFEWYEKNAARFNVKEDLFINAITYIANLNGMNFEAYRNYVYECEKSKIKILEN